MFTGVFAPTKGWGQQHDLTILTYGSATLHYVQAKALDTIFDNVIGDGQIRTSNWSVSNSISNLPISVSGFNNAQCVMIAARGASSTDISQAQADALINYVKGGGILIGNAEQVGVTGKGDFLKYVGEALLCNSAILSATPTITLTDGTISPAPAFHPGNGTLLLTNRNGDQLAALNTATYSVVSGVPCESSIFYGKAPASNAPVLEFIAPAYPKGCNGCGVQGFAILSGECSGALTQIRDLRLNMNYAQLMYDFLYDQTAMANRRAWVSNPNNRSTLCTPLGNCPDFTPTVEIDIPTFLPNTPPRDFIVNISESINAPSNGQVVVKIPKISAFTFTFPATMTTANVNGGTTVTNNQWTFTDNAYFWTATLKTGIVIPPYGINTFGGTVTRNSGVPPNTIQPITSNIVAGSGADSNTTNNSYNFIIKAQF